MSGHTVGGLTAQRAGLRMSRPAVASLAVALALASLTAAPRSGTSADPVQVIVSAVPGAADAVAGAVARLGGRIVRPLGIIDGYAIHIPAQALDALRRNPSVLTVTPDRAVRPAGNLEPGGSRPLGGTGPLAEPAVRSGALSTITRIVGAQPLWAEGITGRGVDVALIDTGIAPVAGLQPGRVVNGPDLSFDYQVGLPASIDAHGHGTHMAGIIAGRDDDATADGAGCASCLNASGYSDASKFVGVAPDARLVNVKVGAFDGAADVSQVIAAIDWVVQHRNDNGLNIRVLNLSYGTDGTQDYHVDPLAYAVEVAWRKGIFVVAAAGNDGSDATSLANPALDPLVLAVAATDPNGTLERSDDTVPAWASRGEVTRHADLVAPGVSVVSLAVPGGFVAQMYPEGVVGTRFRRGSGTSQAAAVTSGVAALLVQKYPDASPDALKTLMMATAYPALRDSAIVRGRGVVDAWKASRGHAVPAGVQPETGSTGTGSLEGARGTAHVAIDGDVLTGEQDIFGAPWDGTTWSGQSWSGQSWSGGAWNGHTWSGATWSGQSWSGTSWNSLSWDNAFWTANAWSGQSWSGQTWSGPTWSGPTWSGQSWSGQSWSGQSWSGQSWSGQSWSGQSWSGQSWSAAGW